MSRYPKEIVFIPFLRTPWMFKPVDNRVFTSDAHFYVPGRQAERVLFVINES
jgi:hypothetical protein